MNQSNSIKGIGRSRTIGDGIAILTRQISLTKQITLEMQKQIAKKTKSAFLATLFKIIEILLQLALIIQRQINLILANALEIVNSGIFRAIQNSKSFKTGSPVELQFS